MRTSFIKKASNIIYSILRLHALIKSQDTHIDITNNDFVIIVITFNNVDILRTQYEHLIKNLEDRFTYVIGDNSSNSAQSALIRAWCREQNISYVKIPKNPLTGIRMSGSHAIALNWCYRNIIQKYKPIFFGFLDHDIFPIVSTRIIPKIVQGMWGVVRTRKEYWWYLWPGFSFFEYAKMKTYAFNFFPRHTGPGARIFLDTGGSNYYSIYQYVDRGSINEAPSTIIDLTTKQKLVPGSDSSQTFEIIDKSWLHLRQISWRSESFNKLDNQETILTIAREFTH